MSVDLFVSFHKRSILSALDSATPSRGHRQRAHRELRRARQADLQRHVGQDADRKDVQAFIVVRARAS